MTQLIPYLHLNQKHSTEEFLQRLAWNKFVTVLQSGVQIPWYRLPSFEITQHPLVSAKSVVIIDEAVYLSADEIRRFSLLVMPITYIPAQYNLHTKYRLP